MNDEQRDHLAKALGNVSQGIAVAAPIAFATGRLSILGLILSLLGTVMLFYVSYRLLGD